MNHQTLLTNYLSNLQVELYMVNYNRCDSDWRDLDYTPTTANSIGSAKEKDG